MPNLSRFPCGSLPNEMNEATETKGADARRLKEVIKRHPEKPGFFVASVMRRNKLFPVAVYAPIEKGIALRKTLRETGTVYVGYGQNKERLLEDTRGDGIAVRGRVMQVSPLFFKRTRITGVKAKQLAALLNGTNGVNGTRRR